MFERFNAGARQAVSEAASEARSMGHNYLGTEHQLLGILRVDGVARDVLEAAGVDHGAARAQVRSIIGLGVDEEALATVGIDVGTIREAVDSSFGAGAFDRAVTGDGGCSGSGFRGPSFTPRAKKVMALALREALAMQHRAIGNEHVLLAILREGEGVAAEILRRLAPDADLRGAVIDALRDAS